MRPLRRLLAALRGSRTPRAGTPSPERLDRHSEPSDAPALREREARPIEDADLSRLRDFAARPLMLPSFAGHEAELRLLELEQTARADLRLRGCSPEEIDRLMLMAADLARYGGNLTIEDAIRRICGPSATPAA